MGLRDSKETVVHGMPQQCGACGHRHRRWEDLRKLPECDVCGCTQFRTHDDETAALDAAEAADVAAFAGRERILTGYAAQSIKQVLAGIESVFHERAGWALPATFGVLHAGTPRGAVPDVYGQTCAAIIAEPLDPPKALYASAGGDPARMIVTAAALGEQKPSWFDRFRVSSGLDPVEPVVAWWSITSMDVVDRRTGEVQASLRELVCVDVDERVYTVVRHRPLPGVPGRGVAASLDTAQSYRRKARPLIERGALDQGPSTGLPMMAEGLLRCVRLCRDEQQLRMIMDTMGAAAEGPAAVEGSDEPGGAT